MIFRTKRAKMGQFNKEKCCLFGVFLEEEQFCTLIFLKLKMSHLVIISLFGFQYHDDIFIFIYLTIHISLALSVGK